MKARNACRIFLRKKKGQNAEKKKLKTHRQLDRERNSVIDREIKRERERRGDRHTVKQTDRQTK